MPLRSRKSRLTPIRLMATAIGVVIVVPMYYGIAQGQAYGYAIAGVVLTFGAVLLVVLVRSRKRVAAQSTGA